MRDFYTIEPCATSNAFEIKFKKETKINLERAAGALKALGEILGQTTVVIFLKSDNFSVSIYASGRVVMKNIDREDASRIANLIADALEKGGAFF